MQDVGRRQFQIQGCLGRGGFGEVYLALMNSSGGLQTEVAVKVLHQGLDPRGQAVQRLRDEGRMLARLNHPTMLRVHDLVLLDDRISLVAEYIEGLDLGDVITGPDRIELRPLLEVIGAVSGALDAAWNAPLAPDGGPLRLVHRDIKPSNIRISRHGQVKLLDFGIARTDSVDREARTQTNMMVGSPAYMAPERFTADESDPASDVFALGCSLFEGMVGERLFEGVSIPILSTMAIDRGRFEAHVEERLGLLPDDVPDPVLQLLVQTLDHDPAHRPSARDLMGACEELADSLPGATLTRWCRTYPWPEVVLDSGPLDGRLITEGTMTRTGVIAPMASADEITRQDTAPEGSLATERLVPAPSRSSRGPAIAVVLALVGLVAVVAVSVGGGVAGGLALGLFERPTPAEDVTEPPGGLDTAVVVREELDAEPVPAPGPDAVAEVAPGEPEVAPEEPAPAPSPVPVPVAAPVVAPVPVPVVRPDPVPVPVPEPAAVLPQPPAPAPTVRVIASGPVSVELVSGSARYTLPAEVPPGTYAIEARFNGRDLQDGGASLTAELGSSYSVECKARAMLCRIEEAD